VDKVSADFAFQMEMIPAVYLVYVLITGAFTIMQDIFTDLPLSHQLFEMAVDGSLPNSIFHILKIAYYLIDRYMSTLEGLKVIKNALPLPGVIIYRTFRHRPVSYHGRLITSI
jgi:hypothetical protein